VAVESFFQTVSLTVSAETRPVESDAEPVASGSSMKGHVVAVLTTAQKDPG